MTTHKTLRYVLTAVILGTLTGLWAVQSDLAYNIAQQRAILLGRYTLEYTSLLLALTPILLLLLKKIWTPRNPNSRARLLAGFKTITITVSVLLALIFIDVAMRLTTKKSMYVKSGASYHRTPNAVFKNVFSDKPEFDFTYPNALPGYPDVPYTLTVDALGFRNPAVSNSYDWLVVGDSFAEGSSVSDEQVWVTQLAEKSGKTIYNLGMSGGSPVSYLDALQKFGIDRHPGTVLYMLYEGNDFRASNFRQEKLESPKRKKKSLSDKLFKVSPLRALLTDAMHQYLGKINSDRFASGSTVNTPNHILYPIAWLPLQVPAAGGYGYAFEVKDLQKYNLTDDAFRTSTAGSESLRFLEQTRQLCETNGIELVVLYAPDKAHILLEDTLNQIPAEQLRAFIAAREDTPPAPDILADQLLAGIQIREQAVRDYCQENNLTFISLTKPLQQKTRQGIRTYYTYDQHWTPEGHTVVADYLHEQLAE